MTLFGEKLKKIIDDNDINIYRLSQRAGIERTIIHKIISAGRIPDAEYIRKLAETLPISPYERDELLEAYKISKAGEFLYNQRIQVHQLVERMCAVQAIPAHNIADLTDGRNTGKPKRSAQIATVSGTLAVNNLIDDVLSRELLADDPYVRFIMPHGYTFFYDILFLKFRKAPVLKVECLFEFFKKSDILRVKRNSNLDIISTLAPFIMHSGNFTAYYAYSMNSEGNAAATPMPYLVVTSNEVVTLTADLQTAVNLDSRKAVDCYGGIFDSMKAKAGTLIGTIASMDETIAFYTGNLGKGESIAGFGSHPCITKYYDNEMLEAHIPEGLPDREQVIEMSMMICNGMKALCANNLSSVYFTVNGLELFAQRGILQTIVENFLTPFKPDERVAVITKMIEDTKNDTLICRAIDTSKLRIPECFYTDVFGGSHINIVVGNIPGSEIPVASDIRTANIFEEGIVEAFRDFLVSAVDTDMLFSKEDTLKTLYRALEMAK